MSDPLPTPHRDHRAELVTVAALIAAAAVIGWVVLEFLKSVIVLATYAFGAALIVVPLVAAVPLVQRETERRQRLRRGLDVLGLVGAGIVLLVVAHVVSRHGWLLVVIPAAGVALWRASRAVAGPHRREEIR